MHSFAGCLQFPKLDTSRVNAVGSKRRKNLAYLHEFWDGPGIVLFCWCLTNACPKYKSTRMGVSLMP